MASKFPDHPELPSTLDGRALKICESGAWSMGRSVISFVHCPDRVYLSMFEELMQLNKADEELAKKFTDFALKEDKYLQNKINGIEEKSIVEESIEPLGATSNKIDFNKLKKDMLLIKGYFAEWEYISNMIPSFGVFLKGMAAHTLLREEISPVTYNHFVGREAYLGNLLGRDFKGLKIQLQDMQPCNISELVLKK